MELKLPARKYLDIWTAHIHKADVDLLDQNVGDVDMDTFMTVYPYDYGVFVMMPDPGKDGGEVSIILGELADYGFSEDFINLIRLALEQDIDIIRFDSDGLAIGELPSFENEWK